ncbi:MAG: lamin tail domain-containing protein [Verrucomicrobiota bacterium]
MSRWPLLLLPLLGSLIRTYGATVFPADTEWRFFRALSEASPQDRTAWRRIAFDDAAWESGRGPFYYEDSPGSATAYTGNTQLGDMRGNYSSLFLRKTFTITNPADVKELQLDAFCDDGFIAWINGNEVARFNMPDGEVPYDGFSLGALNEPVPPENVIVPAANARLVAGVNVLAIQAFNSGLANSSDFVISVALSSSVDDSSPMVAAVIPSANALVQQLTQLEVQFDEDVTGVDAADLLINGQPATRVTAFNGAQYLFEFPQPPDGTVQVSWAVGHGIVDVASAANPFAGGNWSYTLDPNAKPPGLMISEFMADNDNSIHDEDGDSSDWIEIFNNGTSAASLNGYYLTTRSNVLQWRFPNVSLLPNGYLVVFASEKNRTNASGRLHTNFKLDKAGGYLALLDTTGKAVSEFAPYPAQREDVSCGMDAATSPFEAFFPTPTPNAPNVAGGPDFSPEVRFSRSGGTFNEIISLELTTPNAPPDTVIRYTLDGSLPTPASKAYAGPIEISTTTEVRAASYTPGLLPSPPHSESYLALHPSVFTFSSDLPVVVMHNFGKGAVPAGTQQYANIAIFEPGFGRTSLTNQAKLSARAGINLRGSSTRGLAKSSFRVEFWNDYNDDKKEEVLGMPAESDWVLYACNNFEPVLIHNKDMHDLSRQIGRYSPRTRFVEVYVNTTGGPVTSANYNGVYVLLEKIKDGPDRVDIDKLQPEHTAPPQVSGGYLLSVDRSAPNEGQIYGGGLGLNSLSPNWDEITQPQRAAQRQYIEGYLDTMMGALESPNFANPATGYANYVDVPAALDHHILNVLAFNVDALRLSGYLYKPRAGKLTFGPLWDFDRALASTDGRDANPRVWRSTSGDRGTDMFNSDGIFSNPWYSRMFLDIDFWQGWIDRWQELRRKEFALTNLQGLVDSLTGQLREAQPREVARWPGITSPRGSYQAEIDRLKTWLASRVDFIDTNFVAAPRLSRDGGAIAARTTISISGPPGAEIYYTLDGSDPRAAGGALANNGTIYSSTPIVVLQNVRVVARARNLNHQNLTGEGNPPLSSPWSGPVAATFVVSTPTLGVTEIMYHPSAPAAGSTFMADDFEFIELKNTGTQTLSLIGFRFTRGIDYTFTAGSGVTSLNPGDYVVLVKNRTAFLSRYPAVTRIGGEYTGSLNNAGERLTLEGPVQEPIADFTYQNQWFPATDGGDFSLVVANEKGGEDLSFRDSWRVSAASGGSPAASDAAPTAIPPILVNEALTHTDLPAVDTVELYNPTASDANIGGWFLTDDPSEPRKYRIPAGTTIPANGYILFDETQFNADGSGFALGSMGDAIYLFSGDGANLTGYSHGFEFEAAINGVTFGRYLTSIGDEKFVSQIRPTLKAPNAGPLVGPVVISEIMPHPPLLGSEANNRDEYVELFNLGSSPVPLFDPNFPTNTWQIRGGIDFSFPENVTLAAGQALLLVNFDPQADASVLAAFAAAYNINPGTILILGPYKGNLDNAGERVALYRPDAPEPPPSPVASVVPWVLVDEIHYRNQAPWPIDANGTGKSFERINAAAYGDDPVNWHSAAPSPGKHVQAGDPDSDQDGLPDAWETAHGLDPNSASGPNGASGDPDADGLSNAEEYSAGTAPDNARSSLELRALGVGSNGCQLQFQAVGGRTYSILARDELGSGVWANLSGPLTRTDNGPITFSDSGFKAAPVRFYRLVTPAGP